MTLHFLYALYGALLLSLAAAAPPTLHYPLQAQLPPVARVNHTFTWTLLPDTFLADTAMSYRAQDMPSWLSFDANTLSFFGTPTRDDLGNNYVVVQANSSDSAQGTTSGFHCLVVNDASPTIGYPVSAQLQAGGGAVISSAYVQPDGSIRIPPKWSFSLGFLPEMFGDPENQKLYFTAYRAGTVSLPAWMTFDNETVTLNGQSPSNTNNFEINIFGSDRYGYGDVMQTIRINIGQHSFIQTQGLPSVNATAKQAVQYTVPVSGLLLDGVAVQDTSLVSVQVALGNLSNSLSYDTSSRTVSGQLPADLPSTHPISIPVIYTDTFNDTIRTNFTIRIIPTLFASNTLPNYNITGGTSFTGDLKSYLTGSSATYTASFNPANVSSWLSFNNATKQLVGIPPAFDGQDILVNITGRDATAGISESATVNLYYKDANANMQSGGLSNGAKIAIAVVFGTLAGILLVILLMWLCRRYCAANDDDRVDEDKTLAVASRGPAGWFEKSKFRAASPTSDIGDNTVSSQDSDRLDQAMAAAEMSVAANLAAEEQQSRPKRMDFMRVFGGHKSDSQQSMQQTHPNNSGPRSIAQILGMAHATPAPRLPIHAPQQHNIIVVTDHDGHTYTPRSVDSQSMHGDADSIEGPSEADVTRSSFDSQQSSSLFYSEGSSGSGDSPVQRPRPAHTNNSASPQSIPRQRRDFQPYPSAANVSMYPVQQTALAGPSSYPIPPNGGIRLVQPRRISSRSLARSDSGRYADETLEDEDSVRLAEDAAIATAHLEQLNSHPAGFGAADSFPAPAGPAVRPRLMAFNSEHRGERSESPPQEERWVSQRGIAGSAPFSTREGLEVIDESTEDAIEEMEPSRRYSTASAPYVSEGIPREALLYDDTARHETDLDAPDAYRPSSPTKSEAGRSMRSRHTVNSLILEPLRVQIQVANPFHFTAQIYPAPAASIGSQGRDG